MVESASPVPVHKDIVLAQGAWYLAENCLQDLSGCSTTGKVHRWGRAWAFIRGRLDRRVEVEPGVLVDFEKGIARSDGESDTAWQNRVLSFNLAHATWKEQLLPLALSPKHVEAVSQAVKHAVEAKKLAFAAAPGMVTNYAATLVVAFDPAAADSDE